MIHLKTSSIILFFLILISDISYGQTPPVPNGRRLRDIMADKYTDGNLLIGATTGEWAFNYYTGKIMDREFDYVTPENDFKQHQIHPDNTSWNFNKADRWINHVLNNQQTLRIHGPVGPQCSNWAKSDSRTAEELELNMRDFMKGLCIHYNEKQNFEYLDVVNETVIGGNWHKNKAGLDWENPWYKIGLDSDKNKTPLFIKYAFEIANEYAPNLKFIINQHEGTILNSSWGKIKNIVLYLRNMGLRVDGIGWQAHVDAGWEKIDGQPEALKDLIDWAFQNDLEFHITEKSVYIGSTSEIELKKQADTYKAIMDIMVEKSAFGKIAWNTWHIDDGHGWNIDRFPSIFDEDYNAKPAYYAIQLALEAKGDYTTEHNVAFKIKNLHTNENVENCQISFNNETKFTNADGIVDCESTAGIYSLSAEKRFMKSFQAKNLSIYSDTIFTFLMDTTETIYDITFQLEDELSGNNISLVNIEMNSEEKVTDSEGKTTFNFPPGKYLTSFDKANYFSAENEYQINSDTTFAVELRKSHGTIKFRVKDGTQPVNKALIVLGSDSLYTSALGICKFKSVLIGDLYYYQFEKEYYNAISDNFLFRTDTTISLQAIINVANIEFNISADSGSVENAFVVLNGDSAWFNENGQSKLYNIEKNKTHSYEVFSDSHLKYEDAITIQNDTSLFVLVITSLSDNHFLNNSIKVFPNPAKDYLQFTSNSEIRSLELLNLNGQLLRQFGVASNAQNIDVTELPAGYYLLKFNQKDNSLPIIKKIIIQK